MEQLSLLYDYGLWYNEQRYSLLHHAKLCLTVSQYSHFWQKLGYVWRLFPDRICIQRDYSTVLAGMRIVLAGVPEQFHIVG